MRCLRQSFFGGPDFYMREGRFTRLSHGTNTNSVSSGRNFISMDTRAVELPCPGETARREGYASLQNSIRRVHGSKEFTLDGESAAYSKPRSSDTGNDICGAGQQRWDDDDTDQACGCDFPGKHFLRSLLWNLSERNESEG